MATIDQTYKFTSSIFTDIKDQILLDIETSQFKKTAKILYRQQLKLESFLNTLLNIRNNEDCFYAIQILHRTAIEHFLLGHYVWVQSKTNKNDKTAEEYYLNYSTSEFFKRENYELRVESIRRNVSPQHSFQELISKFPEFKELKEHELHEIHIVSKQFDIRDILNYLINDSNINKYFSEFHFMILQALSEYNYLSSYVHGGPSAELECYENIPEIDKSKKIEDCIQMVKIYCRTIKEHLIFLFAEYDINYFKVLSIIMEFKAEANQ